MQRLPSDCTMRKHVPLGEERYSPTRRTSLVWSVFFMIVFEVFLGSWAHVGAERGKRANSRLGREAPERNSAATRPINGRDYMNSLKGSPKKVPGWLGPSPGEYKASIPRVSPDRIPSPPH